MKSPLTRWPRLSQLAPPDFTKKEIGTICVMVLFLSVVLVGAVFLLVPEERRPAALSTVGGDFPQFYVAGRILNSGSAERLYDLQLQERLFLDIRPKALKLTLPFIYPPFLALLCRPIALLPYGMAYFVWVALSAALFVSGVLLLLEHRAAETSSDRRLILLIVMSFPPLLVETLLGGQISSIGFFALSLAIHQERLGQWFAAGLTLSICLYKPTILLLILPMLVLSRRWKILAGLMTGAVVLVAGVAALIGTNVFADYFALSATFGRLYLGTEGLLKIQKYVDLRDFAVLLTGRSAAGLGVLLAASACCLPFLARWWWRFGNGETARQAAPWASTLAWTLVLNIYVPIYDCSLLAISFLIGAQQCQSTETRAYRPLLHWLALATVVSAWLSQPIASLTRVQVFTLVLIVNALFFTLLELERAGVDFILPKPRTESA